MSILASGSPDGKELTIKVGSISVRIGSFVTPTKALRMT